MSLSTQPYKGTRDFYPDEKRVQKWMFSKLRSAVESFGYQEYDAPIIEPIDLYLAKTGEEIVNEQLYSFEDRGGRKMAIRPEMTPSVSRMVAAKRQELAYPLRLYSIPNLWRYERPQRGRLREHWQLNIDLFGVEGIEGDHEIIVVADSILKKFGAKSEDYTIRISSRQLVEYFLHDCLGLKGRLSIDAQKLIDRKHKVSQDEFEKDAHTLMAGTGQADRFLEFAGQDNIEDLPPELSRHASVTGLKKLMMLLRESGVTTAVLDTSIVRGMEYYTDIIFEVFDNNPENNRSMFGGGRYDGLVGLFGAEPVPTVGFGMGDVTLYNFLKEHDLVTDLKTEAHASVLLIGDVYEQAQPIITKLRQAGVNIAVDPTDRKLDAKLRHAEKSGVMAVVFIGEEEIKNGTVKLKNFKSGKEETLKISEAAQSLKAPA